MLSSEQAGASFPCVPSSHPAHHVRVFLRVRDTDVSQLDVEILRKAGNTITDLGEDAGSQPPSLLSPPLRTSYSPVGSYLVHRMEGSTDAVKEERREEGIS